MNNIKNIFYLNLYLTRYSLSFLVFYGKQGEQRTQKLPYQILGGTTVENVQIDPRTTEILPKKAKRPVSEGVSLRRLSKYREAELIFHEC